MERRGIFGLMMRLLAYLRLMALALYALQLMAQAHSVTLSWQDLLNPPEATYNVYRSAGRCSSSSPFQSGTQISSGVFVKTYLDTSVASKAIYCYQVTAVLSAQESIPSLKAEASIGGSNKKPGARATQKGGFQPL